MKKTGKLLSIFLIPEIIISFFTACSTSQYVYVQQDKYTPGFSARDFSDYKGKAIILNSFTNRAENTSIFYYYSDNENVKYEGSPTLHSYLWYCFKKAFIHIGVFVEEPKGPIFSETIVPEGMKMMELEFNSFTDTELSCNINLFKEKKLIYQKNFAVSVPLIANRNSVYLEKNAYMMMDKVFTTIISDKGFREAFIK